LSWVEFYVLVIFNEFLIVFSSKNRLFWQELRGPKSTESSGRRNFEEARYFSRINQLKKKIIT